MVFQSTIIIGYNSSEIKQAVAQLTNSLSNEISSNNPDIHILNQDTGWGIEQIRDIKKFLSRKPISHTNKIVIINEAHNLTTESQNALLKSLEEPPQDAYFILSTHTSANLLPTILSRCHLIKITSRITAESQPLLHKQTSIKDNIALSDSLGLTRDNAQSYLENQIVLHQQQLLNHPEYAHTIKKLIKCVQMCKANLDPKNILDWFLLS